MAIINDNSDEGGVSFPFYEYFPDLEFDTWKRALEKYEKRIKPLPLVLYLEDRWGDRLSGWQRLRDSDRDDLAGNTGKIIDLIRETYGEAGGCVTIEDYLAGIDGEVRQKKRERKEQAIRDEITGLINEKHWFEGSGYIKDIKIEAGDYSDEFIYFLDQCKKKIESGRDWIRQKGKLRRLIEQEDLEGPIDLMNQCLNDRDNIKYLYGHRDEYGDDNDRDELAELAADYYGRIMSLVKDRQGPADALKKVVDEIERNSKDMFPDLPGEWITYKSRLSDQIKDSIDKGVGGVIEKSRLDNLGEAVDRLEATVVSQLDNIPDIESYVQSHLDSLRKLCENSYILDTIPKSEDSESLKNLLNKVDDVGKDIEIKRAEYGEVANESTLFRELEGKHKKNRDMISEALDILGDFDDLVDVLEEESKKILQGSEVRVSLNIRKYRERMRAIAGEILRLVKLHDNIKFLLNLKERVIALNRLIFQGGPGQKAEPPLDLLGEVAEKVSLGDRFYEAVRFLNQPENNEPLPLMEGLLETMKQYRNQDFIFRSSVSAAVKDNLEETIGKIRRKIDEELSGMEEIVTAFYQLPTPAESGKIDRFHERFLFVQEQKAVIHGDFDDIKKLLEARRERVDKIDALGRVLQLIRSQQYSEARDLKESVKSFEKVLKDRLEAVIYFNEHLDKRQWHESDWLYFFEHLCPLLVTAENQSRYREIFNRYETLLKEELFNLPPRDLEKHTAIFEKYLKDSDLFAYIMLIKGKYTGKDFIEYIKTREAARALYHAFLDYLNRFGMWQIYVDLYRSAYGELGDAFGEAPLDRVHDTLEEQYHLLEERFCSGTISRQEIEGFDHRIPRDDEFKYYRKKHDLLAELLDKYQRIEETFTRYKNRDTWEMKELQDDLNELERVSNSFSGKFEKIKIDMDWDETLRHLRKFYHTGTGILGKFSIEPYRAPGGPDLDELEHIKDKNAAAYSDKLRAFLIKVWALWEDFNRSSDELAGAGWKLKEKFNNDFFAPLLQKWQQVEFSRLWKQENLPLPENAADFLQLFKTILDNLERYLGFMEKGDISRYRDSFKILDPFIAGKLRDSAGNEPE
jgi:hypothetical protein